MANKDGDVTAEISRPKGTDHAPDKTQGLEFTDINNERYRVYVFPAHGTFVSHSVTITNPVKLNVKRKPEGDSHRVIDGSGTSHYIPAGWVHLWWVGKDGTAYTF